MQELLVSSLATADAVAKLMIEKGLITKDEFMVKLKSERAGIRRCWGRWGKLCLNLTHEFYLFLGLSF